VKHAKPLVFSSCIRSGQLCLTLWDTNRMCWKAGTAVQDWWCNTALNTMGSFVIRTFPFNTVRMVNKHIENIGRLAKWWRRCDNIKAYLIEVWCGFKWLHIVSVGELLAIQWWTFVLHKSRAIFTCWISTDCWTKTYRWGRENLWK
jgi:hypothetical protein